MPGGKEDYNDILTSLKKGTLSRQQLQINASRLYHLTQKLKKHKTEV